MKPINQWTEEDVEALQIKMDNVLRRIVQGTIVLCGLMIVVGVTYQLFTK